MKNGYYILYPCQSVFFLTNIAININIFLFNFLHVWIFCFMAKIRLTCLLNKFVRRATSKTLSLMNVEIRKKKKENIEEHFHFCSRYYYQNSWKRHNSTKYAWLKFRKKVNFNTIQDKHVQITFLIDLANFSGKHTWGSTFCIKVEGSRSEILTKRSPLRVSFKEFCKTTLKTTNLKQL